MVCSWVRASAALLCVLPVSAAYPRQTTKSLLPRSLPEKVSESQHVGRNAAVVNISDVKGNYRNVTRLQEDSTRVVAQEPPRKGSGGRRRRRPAGAGPAAGLGLREGKAWATEE